MKTVLGLDLGTNSIGGALVRIGNLNEYGKEGSIEWLGSRIIPVDGDYLQKFETGGQAETKAAARRMKRGSRRLKHRYKLRRARLIKVFKILGWLDESFPLDNPAEFKKKINADPEFKFSISDYLPFEKDKIKEATKLLGIRNKKGELKIPEDWVVYYLRKKALIERISVKELCRIMYMMNQRRGFKSSRKDLKETTILNYDEFKKTKDDIESERLKEYLDGNGQELETKFVAITKIKTVVQDGEEKDRKGNYTFQITAEDERLLSWPEKRKQKPEWEGTEREFTLVVTQKIDKKGKLSQNKPQFPKEDDWELTMVALDNQIDEHEPSYPGAFFFDKLADDKNYKIRQTAVRREKYKNELEAIWKIQVELRKKENEEQEILNEDKLEKIVIELYKHNVAKQKELKEKGLYHIIADDIIYYQRELKSQKNSVGECQYEKHKGIDEEIYGVKCASKSTPEFQEFRMWQDIHNLRIFERERVANGITKIDVDVTKNFIDATAKEKLFELFDSSREISERNIFDELNMINGAQTLTSDLFRINLFANREKLPGNETKELFRKAFRKHEYLDKGEEFLSNKETFRRLWHIIYSTNSSDYEKSSKGIRTALSKFSLPNPLIEAFTKLPEVKKQYASYSTKAINKLLPLMRCGKYWCWDDIQDETKQRIEKIIKDGWDFAYDKRTGELIKERKFEGKERFAGLPVWMACYVVYGRHSERESDKKFSGEELRHLDIMKLIPNNSLRNPIVEQVIRETMFLVKDVCNRYGQPDEIHIELGGDLKKNALEKERLSKINSKNFEEKQRVKELLTELLSGSFEHYDEEGKMVKRPFDVNPNPESPADIEKFRIYKSCGTISNDEEKEQWDTLFKNGKKERIPTNAEIKKYILWLSQKCASPYTGKIISLSRLFSEDYEVEHIIPRKRLKYDAFENLVICERGVNKLKGNELAMNFISKHNGAELRHEGRNYRLFDVQAYTAHCKTTFKGRKLKNLLATEVPEDFISRQINNTRYITRKVSELLYPIAKDKEGLIFTIGSITGEMKNEWGLNNVWKEILKPRFQRLEKIENQQMIVPDKENVNKFHFQVPENPELELKRLDHRHHAMDALIIAATTREHIRYLNSLNAIDNDEELKKVRHTLVKGKIREFRLPWASFTKDAKEKLNETIVTFKSNNRVVSRPKNRYVHWVPNPDGGWEKKEFYQEPTSRWMAVRKSMFKEPQGIIWIKEKGEVPVIEAFKVQIERMKVEHDKEKRRTTSYVYDKAARLDIKEVIDRIGINIEETERLLETIKEFLKKNSDRYRGRKVAVAEFVEYAAKKVRLDASFTHDKIDKIPYSDKLPLAKLLRSHLKSYNDKPGEAFGGEGMEVLSKKAGKKIDTVTIYEKKSPDDKFGKRYVEVDKGAIAYFIIYENEETKDRPEMYSLATHKAIERLVQGKPLADRKDGFKTIILSPNDLVYVPTEEELNKTKNGDPSPVDWNNKKKISERIYKMVSSSKGDCLFVQHQISKAIIPTDIKEKIKGEIDWHNKSTKTMDGKTMIAGCCVKLNIDRLGNIKPAL